jgi:RNA polymerase sigma-70 factor (ECF subfamily)
MALPSDRLERSAPSDGGEPPARPARDGRQSPPSGLAILYCAEHGKLVRYLKRRVDDDLALDIAHDVFVRAASTPDLLRLTNPGGYLCRIAQHLLIDRERKIRRRGRMLPLTAAIDAPAPPQQERDLVASDIQRTLDRALGALPERTRRIFVMHRFEDKAYAEIHRELGISLGAVEYHMTRALAHIRGAVSGEP